LTHAIAFENVTKSFRLTDDRPRSFKEAFVGLFRPSPVQLRSLLALDDVSFALEHGEALGLIGPNGTGKSTSLKLIARILEPTAGRVVVDGRVAALLELGTGFHPDLTGRENIYLNGSLLGLSRREMRGRLQAIVDFSELGRFIDMPVKHYSSGMYMRLGFSTAIHVDAEILLIDEVLAVGDQAFQNRCREKIADLRKAGITILLVSHSTEAVRELCGRALWLEGGRILADGATDDVIEAYYASVVAKEEVRFAAQRGAQPASPAGGAAGSAGRFGSGEVEIVGVELLDGEGRECQILHTGRPAVIRVLYTARERVEQPVFGLAIHRDDGVHVSGPNTLDARLDIPFVEGEGALDYRIDALALMEGSYELSASCYDWTCSHPYDHHHRRFPMRVRAGSVRERFGLLWMPATWVHSPGTAAAGIDSPGGNPEGNAEVGGRGAGPGERGTEGHDQGEAAHR